MKICKNCINNSKLNDACFNCVCIKCLKEHYLSKQESLEEIFDENIKLKIQIQDICYENIKYKNYIKDK